VVISATIEPPEDQEITKDPTVLRATGGY